MLNCTFLKGSLTNLREVSGEGLNIIFRFKRANCIHNSSLLLSLPLPETANTSRLDEMGLMRRELNDPNMVHFGFENELRSLMVLSTIH
jgi:hypothetical protein